MRELSSMEGQSPKLGKNNTIAQNDVSQTQQTITKWIILTQKEESRRSPSPSNMTLHMASQVGFLQTNLRSMPTDLKPGNVDREIDASNFPTCNVST